MTFNEIIDTLDCRVFHRSTHCDDDEIHFAAAGDLISEVLVVDEGGGIIITALVSDQVLRTVDIIGAPGVLLVTGNLLSRTCGKWRENSASPSSQRSSACLQPAATWEGYSSCAHESHTYQSPGRCSYNS